MKLTDYEIDMPNEKEKKESIQFILKNRSTQPKSFSRFIVSFFKEINPRVIFWGLEEVFIITVSFVGCLLVILAMGLTDEIPHLFLFEEVSEKAYFFSFLLSPVVFALLHYLSIWKEIQLKTYELKMTLKLSLKEIMLVRTFIFSIISLFGSVLLSIFIWIMTNQTVSLLKLISLSSASLFLFSIVQLMLDSVIPIRFSYLVSPVIWLGVAVILISQKDKLINLLLILPESLVFVLTIIFLMTFIVLLRRNYINEKEGGLSYVRA